MNIGFVGLGNMGGPMAANLVRAGHRVTGCDVVAEAAEALRAQGGQIAASPAEAVRGTEIVITMLPAGEHVRAVYGDDMIEAAAGALLIDCSTIDVQTARDVAGVARNAGLAMLDAPVSGGVAGATAGTLTFMVGGPADAFAQAEPVLRAMGRTIVHAGDAGAGQAAKICNNMILGISMLGVCEAFVLARRLGLDAAKLFEISATASGQCWSLTSYCPAPGPVPAAPSNRGYAAGFAAALMLKDLSLAQQAAEAADAATPLGARAAALYEQLVASGQGGRDFSAALPWLDGMTRAQVVRT